MIEEKKKKTESRDLEDTLRKFAPQNLIEEHQHYTERK